MEDLSSSGGPELAAARRISRRRVLKLGAAAAAASVGGGAAALPSCARAQSIDARAGHQPPAAARTVRNIIFMIADGMSASVPALAQDLSKLVRHADTNWHRLALDARTTHGLFDMASLNSPVTDSAAAASAWATGSRIFNTALNVLPDGTKLTPVGVLAKEAGRGVGLVTTTRITHATPAAFAAVASSRDDEDQIAPQYLGVADVLLGGGSRHFDPTLRADRRDLLADFGDAGYATCSTRDELRADTTSKRVLGLFDANHLPYTIDCNREASLQARVPALAEMTRAALERLASLPNGFLLQIEGGRVDHAAHNNDGPAMIWDQLAFDDAIGVVMEFRAKHPDTLVVITSDHGCGNPGLNGLGLEYEQSGRYFEKVASATASFEAMDQRLRAASFEATGAPPTAEQILEALQWGTGLTVDARHGALIADVLAGKPPPELNMMEANIYGVVAQIVGNHNGLAWTGIVHTSDWTLCMAVGPGSERFAGLLKNTDAYQHMTALLGIEHRNPSMTAEQARKFALSHRRAEADLAVVVSSGVGA